MSTCEACSHFKQHPLSGRYSLTCVECCCRLVLSAHPNKNAAAAMLAAIDRQPGNPGRAQVLASVRQALEKHH